MRSTVWLVFLSTVLLGACGSSSTSGSSGDSAGSGQVDGEVPGESAGGETPTVAESFGEPLSSQIRPGVEVVADGASCTSNFLYQLNDTTVYLGVAAHCFSPDTNQGVDPCEAANLPLGTPVQIQNAAQPGELAYSSWQAMQEVGESAGSAACTHNDFALVKLSPDALANIPPATIAFGGPTALASQLASEGEAVFVYGQSPFHFGVRELEAMNGSVIGIAPEGWAYDVLTDTPAISGDSGGPVLDSQGRALAVTSALSVSLSLTPVRNSVTNLARALRYAKDNGFIHQDVQLMTWAELDPSGGL
ncbi:serine protease [Spongiibacter sp.]|uniref:S1 family peptidase n=1 Tax=Spongiibacter sp. TaxID=2024860 RepID=UPI000C6144AB|nr:serine protease [Spongiibacter sp.]MAY39132.1 serine protease [Spongiibacter sp.]